MSNTVKARRVNSHAPHKHVKRLTHKRERVQVKQLLRKAA